ncbi:hypothetical protein [Desulfonema magnum]|uniref:Uncharacterized protein n=1 Tax=Desulfonema magnum TaxID=45655 RepID=A0A975BKW3_9BACT|nr:hypothetical protein [Desulfonema magnum]QTA87293.1 Uncharacterized protein dnm_033230 [Desulfonema magnum]
MWDKKKKIAASCLAILISVAFYLLSNVNLAGIDSRSDRYFRDLLKKTALSYASVRGINAVVSMIKDSDMSISPTGVGVNIAVGQILDPIDDMTERLSSVLVASIASLGVQKVAMEIGNSVCFKIISFAFPLLLIPLWLNRKYSASVFSLSVKTVSLCLILRFFLPLSAIADDLIYKHFFESQIAEAKVGLALIPSDSSASLGDVGDIQKESGIWEKAKGTYNTVRVKTREFREAFSRIKDNADEITDSLLKLVTAYIALFIFQVIVIPPGVLWILVKLSGKVFDTDFEDKILSRFRPEHDKTEVAPKAEGGIAL